MSECDITSFKADEFSKTMSSMLASLDGIEKMLAKADEDLNEAQGQFQSELMEQGAGYVNKIAEDISEMKVLLKDYFEKLSDWSDQMGGHLEKGFRK